MWAYIVNDITKANLPILWNFILSTSAWVIYTLDHLIDGYKKHTNEKINRHYFVFENRKLIIPVLIFVSIALVVISIFVFKNSVIVYGILLTLLSAVYLFAINHTKLAVKEFFASLIFTLGIWFVPFIYSQSISYQVYGFAILFFFCVLFNIIYLAIAEYAYDKANNFNGLVQIIGKKNGILLLYLIWAFQTLIYIFIIKNKDFDLVMALVLIMLIAEIFILVYQQKIEKISIHRQVADGVFLLAIIYPFIKFLELIL